MNADVRQVLLARATECHRYAVHLLGLVDVDALVDLHPPSRPRRIADMAAEQLVFAVRALVALEQKGLT